MISALLREPASPPPGLRLVLHGGAPMPTALLRRAVAQLGCSFTHDGTRCAPGEVGEVTLAGPGITPGYWNRPAETASALRHGWLWTGDLGHVDADGPLPVN